jgi:hypothetical protein
VVVSTERDGWHEVRATDHGVIRDDGGDSQSTSNTHAFHRAFTHALAEPGGRSVVITPAGSYYFADTLQVPARVTLRGELPEDGAVGRSCP